MPRTFSLDQLTVRAEDVAAVVPGYGGHQGVLKGQGAPAGPEEETYSYEQQRNECYLHLREHMARLWNERKKNY